MQVAPCFQSLSPVAHLRGDSHTLTKLQGQLPKWTGRAPFYKRKSQHVQNLWEAWRVQPIGKGRNNWVVHFISLPCWCTKSSTALINTEDPGICLIGAHLFHFIRCASALLFMPPEKSMKWVGSTTDHTDLQIEIFCRMFTQPLSLLQRGRASQTLTNSAAAAAAAARKITW